MPDTETQQVRLLRGRVMVRPTVIAKTHGGIIIPETARDKRDNRASLGRGIVVLVGPPAYTKHGGALVPQEFKVVDDVLYVGQHVSRKVMWNGEEVAMCSQEEVQAVIE